MEFHHYCKRMRSDNENFEENILADDDDDNLISIDFEDKQLINQVKLYSCLYEYKNKKNENNIKEAWLSIANTLDRSVEDCQHRWTILRQRYCKQRRMREDKGIENSEIPEKISLYHFMNWIDPYIQRRKGTKKCKKVLKTPINNTPADGNQEPPSCTAVSVCNDNVSNVNQNSVTSLPVAVVDHIIANDSNEVTHDSVFYEKVTAEDEPVEINSNTVINDANVNPKDIASNDITATILSNKENCAAQTTYHNDDTQTSFDYSDNNDNDFSDHVQATESSDGSTEKDMPSNSNFNQDTKNGQENEPQSKCYDGYRKQLVDITSKLNNVFDERSVIQKTNTKKVKSYDLLGQLVEETLMKLENEKKRREIICNIMKILYDEDLQF